MKLALCKAFVLLCGFIVGWTLTDAARAQSFPACTQPDDDGDGWGWENNQSCKHGANSNTPKDAVIYVGFKVTWSDQPLATRHELEINRNAYGWQWLHTANVSDGQTSRAWKWSDVPNMNINEGDSFCVRYRSTDGSTWTDYSEVACERRPVQTIQPELYKPANPDLSLY